MVRRHPHAFAVAAAIFFLFCRRTASYAEGELSGLLLATCLVGFWIAFFRVRSLRDLIKELPAALGCLIATAYFYSYMGSMMSGRPSESEFYDLVIGLPAGLLLLLGGEVAGSMLGAFNDRRASVAACRASLGKE